MSCGQSPSNYNCLSCSYSRTSDALRPDDIGQNFYLVKISKDFHMSLLFKRIKNKMLNVFKISHCILSNVGEVWSPRGLTNVFSSYSIGDVKPLIYIYTNVAMSHLCKTLGHSLAQRPLWSCRQRTKGKHAWLASTLQSFCNRKGWPVHSSGLPSAAFCQPSFSKSFGFRKVKRVRDHLAASLVRRPIYAWLGSFLMVCRNGQARDICFHLIISLWMLKVHIFLLLKL